MEVGFFSNALAQIVPQVMIVGVNWVVARVPGASPCVVSSPLPFF